MRGYDAERPVFRRRRRALTMAEAREVAAKLFAHFGLPPIRVDRTNASARGGSWYWEPYKDRPPRIRLDQLAPDWVVCHEVAHYVADMLGDSGHGNTWAGAYVEAVRVAITPSYARRLELSMLRTGLAPIGPPW